jgi:hypothetical protein
VNRIRSVSVSRISELTIRCQFRGEDSDGSGDARVASAVRNKPPILVGMPEKVVNDSLRATDIAMMYWRIVRILKPTFLS